MSKCKQVHANESGIAQAAQIIKDGGTVAFPTETVYGLGASALRADAIQKIYDAKGRPSHNPLIVHVASVDDIPSVATEITESAKKLLDAFSPGPLSVVLPKQQSIPDIVSADLETIAVRVPSHPVARKIIERAGCPVAAPSANVSNKISPTTAAHVLRTLDGRIDCIVDGGATNAGLESTVVDCTVSPPRLLRPGPITVADIEQVVGSIDASLVEFDDVIKSPGMLKQHYAPDAKLVVVSSKQYASFVESHSQESIGCIVITVDPSELKNAAVVHLPNDAKQYSAQLYAALHTLDEKQLDLILVEEPPKDANWHAAHDRLQRASS